jgi:hypothetical protein
MTTATRAETFHEIRRRVLDWGTRPLNGDPKTHVANKDRARKALAEACRPFDPALSPDAFWSAAWRAFRDDDGDLAAHEKVGPFKDFRALAGPEWDFPRQATAKTGWGAAARAYIDGASPFDDPALDRDGGRLKKSIQVARALDQAVAAHGDGYLEGMFGAGFPDALGDTAGGAPNTPTVLGWLDHYLGLISGDNDAVGLRLMAALGLPAAAPDPVSTGILFRLGWLDGQGLPKAMTRDEAVEKHDQRRVYKAVHAALHDLAAGIDPIDGNDPAREAAWCLAAYGRGLAPEAGIARVLDAELPVEKAA